LRGGNRRDAGCGQMSANALRRETCWRSPLTDRGHARAHGPRRALRKVGATRFEQPPESSGKPWVPHEGVAESGALPAGLEPPDALLALVSEEWPTRRRKLVVIEAFDMQWASGRAASERRRSGSSVSCGAAARSARRRARGCSESVFTRPKPSMAFARLRTSGSKKAGSRWPDRSRIGNEDDESDVAATHRAREPERLGNPHEQVGPRDPGGVVGSLPVVRRWNDVIDQMRSGLG